MGKDLEKIILRNIPRLNIYSRIFKDDKFFSEEKQNYTFSTDASLKTTVDLFSNKDLISKYVQPFFERNKLFAIISPQQAVITVILRYSCNS